MTYSERKERARARAIEWQSEFADSEYSWEGILLCQDYFAKLGSRYGLTREFRENGII